MNTTFQSGLLVAVVALLCGCANMKNDPERRSDADVRDLFNHALVDCQKANCDPVAAISLLSSHYWLPQSVEPLIRKGANALPLLKELSRSSDFAEKQLASTCIELIEAPRLEKGTRRTEDKSGITLVSFTASR
ncbi:MAG TPA: hypothetical protein VN887_12520 [Candidatus Angelobacter sp.]|nr:hypothetical protein [Candidatus Angelobacter sp.]